VWHVVVVGGGGGGGGGEGQRAKVQCDVDLQAVPVMSQAPVAQ
jgi:hypothetical protein